MLIGFILYDLKKSVQFIVTYPEQYTLLATDGMLVKRPIVVTEDVVLTGFKESEWAEKLLG